ncbi:MAG: hypothetical protein HY040_18990 [Planctomycetes bacterium]|nr:hypothetical protein [Planctomycetota bacterium]
MHTLRWFVAAAFLAGLFLLPTDQAVNATQVKNTRSPQVKRPTFKAPTRTNVKLYRVQIRAPYWQAMGIAPNHSASVVVRRTLNRQGWHTRARTNRAGQIAIIARMAGWHTRARTTNPAMATQAGAYWRAQGFQVRVR